MGRRILVGFAVLGCIFPIPPQSGQADDAQVALQKVMPDALAALERMGEHLKTLSQFTLSAATTSEDVLDDGEKVMIGGDITYHVKSPDRLRLDIATDKRERHYFYNGNTVTVYAPALKFYSIFAAPDTIAKTIEEAEETYDIEVPLADLFYLGTKGSKADASNIISAFHVSDSTINGAVCAHYAYRTATTDFQVWIHKEGEPLPCKIVRNLVDDPARPQYTAVLTGAGSGFWIPANRYGSLADHRAHLRDVRFTPDSGHLSVQVGCPKSARSGHAQARCTENCFLS